MLYSRLLLLFFTHSCTLRFGRFRGKLKLEFALVNNYHKIL